ncbi:hypothetical protein Ssi03_26190 [Sphaerisporangium siamense]|uniref:Uncharacterized protein n=1 Tax=Sphaerisporangium siamense TaxID=795645 RepID=A0A7W7D720_9ACTN|nr:hypothetical protein [Sphaerisporangium siamense]MBB4700053.1 hypothetical protein [Sphaerisporangium siamense]GII84629.1 hypothetical protein Ssi03_26190 [Sphaerisporangium siamense]
MHEELAAALEPVLRDLRTTCVVPFEIREPSGLYWDGLAGAMFYGPDGSGQGVSVTPGADPVEQTAWLADQVQEWAVEALWAAGLPAVWPHCPAHPDSHPLTAEAKNGRAAWFCPRTGEQIALIGELPAVA